MSCEDVQMTLMVMIDTLVIHHLTKGDKYFKEEFSKALGTLDKVVKIQKQEI